MSDRNYLLQAPRGSVCERLSKALGLMAAKPVYFHVVPDGPLPDVAHLSPFRAMVVIDAFVTSEWQEKVSAWLVRSSCLYMLAWGRDCSSWDDSVDIANLEQFGFGEIPEGQFVVTTWHAGESLSEAFDFCKRHAVHPVVELPHTILLHISERGDAARMAKAYVEA